MRREHKDDRMREEMRDLYENQIRSLKLQMNYEQQKMAIECEELKKKIEKLELKSSRRIKIFILVTAGVGLLSFFAGMMLKYSSLIIIIMALLLMLTFIMKQRQFF